MYEDIVVTEINPIHRPDKVTFWSVVTQDGRKMSVWDEEVAGRMLNMKTQNCQVVVKATGNFLNIRAMKEAEQPMTKAEPIVNAPKTPLIGKQGNAIPVKDPVGLAVEVFVAIWRTDCEETMTDAMKIAVDLVKQAQEAFN